MTTTRDDTDGSDGHVPFENWDQPRGEWLLSGGCREGQHRTLLLEMTTRALFPTVLVFSLYLLLVGHYSTGGGFSGGLVAGLAFVLRYIAGGGVDVSSVVRVRPPVVVGIGLTIAVVAALVPVAFGGAVLSSAKWSAGLPVFGTVELQTSLFLDVGVYLLIVGVVLDLLRALGAGVERDMRDAGEEVR
jgi:multicomponent Na+:H+ antiporter subunit B